MQNKLSRVIKATITSIIVAFFFSMVILLGIYFLLEDNIKSITRLIDTVSLKKIEYNFEENNKINEINITGDKVEAMKEYPQYGENYARLIINSIDLNLPVYFGDDMKILKKGVGHSTGSYFPGEGGSIIYMAHNAQNMFRNFSKLKDGDIVEIYTEYGIFHYKINKMEIIKETQIDKLPIQNEKEVLMMYTCYPFKNIGYTTKRYVVYANLVE